MKYSLSFEHCLWGVKSMSMSVDVVVVVAWVLGSGVVLLISAVSMTGALIIPFMNARLYHYVLSFMVSLAVGSLSGSSIFHLIPQVAIIMLLMMNKHARIIHATCKIFHATCKIFHAICKNLSCNMQNLSCNMQNLSCNMQKSFMQHARIIHATCKIFHATCKIFHAICKNLSCSMQESFMQHAKSFMQYAKIFHATCKIFHATCKNLSCNMHNVVDSDLKECEHFKHFCNEVYQLLWEVYGNFWMWTCMRIGHMLSPKL